MTERQRRPKVRPSSNVRWAGAIFLLLLGVYHLNGDFLIGNDATPNVYLAVNVLHEGSLSFSPSKTPFMFNWSVVTDKGPIPVVIPSWDQQFQGTSYRQLAETGALKFTGPQYYLVPSVRKSASGEGIFVNIYGPGSALMALPLYALLHFIFGHVPSEEKIILWYGAKFTAAALVAASAAFVFLAAAMFTNRRRAAAISLAYGLGTCVWSISSQTLWQHGPTEFWLAGGIYVLARLSKAPGSWKWAAACGLALSAATACRPTSAVVAIAVAVYLAITDRRALFSYILGCAPIAVLLAAYNKYYLGVPWDFGQAQAGHAVALAMTGVSDLWQTPLWLGAAGLLVSPSRGLLVYSPFLIFAAWGIVLAWQRKELAFLRPLIVAMTAILVIAFKWFDWWGGWSYGYRPIVDTMPVFAILLAPAIDGIRRSRTRTALFATLLAWSVLVQGVGAWSYDLKGWNNRYLGLEVYPASPGPSIVVKDIEGVQTIASTQPIQGYREVGMDIDRPQYRHRLWSISDCQILYHLLHFDQSRSSKHLQMQEWLDGRPNP